MEGNDAFSVNFRKFVVDEPRQEHARQMARGMIYALYIAKVNGKSDIYASIIENLLDCARKDVEKGDMPGAFSTIRYINGVLDGYKHPAFNQKASTAYETHAASGREEASP